MKKHEETTTLRGQSRNDITIGEHEKESRKTPDKDVEKQPELTTAMVDFGEAPSDASSDLVDWDGENDPEKPLNWARLRKTKNIVIICYLTFLTFVYMASSVLNFC